MNRKQKEFLFIALMAFWCMITTEMGMALLFWSPSKFIASLGPFLAGWFVFFHLRKELHGSEQKTRELHLKRRQRRSKK